MPANKNMVDSIFPSSFFHGERETAAEKSFERNTLCRKYMSYQKIAMWLLFMYPQYFRAYQTVDQ